MFGLAKTTLYSWWMVESYSCQVNGKSNVSTMYLEASDRCSPIISALISQVKVFPYLPTTFCVALV